MYDRLPKGRILTLQKVTLNKSIQARKLSPSGVLTSDPEETIPYGSIIEGVQRDRDVVRFRYLGYLYRCPYEVLASAVDRGALEADQPSAAKPPASAPVTAEDTQPKLEFASLRTPFGLPGLFRAKVAGGWLVTSNAGGVTFYPDPEHGWDGGSL